MNRIGIVGCGNLGRSLAEGIRKADKDTELIISRRNTARIADLADKSTVVTDDNSLVLDRCNLVLLTLKPYAILPFLKEHADLLDPGRHTIVSAATGVTITEITMAIGKELPVYRIMPNTATSVNESLTAVCTSPAHMESEELTNLLSVLGQVVYIDESLMESATILGACGVAYVLRFMRAMIQGGIEVGFDAETATCIVSQTMKGAAELIIQHKSHPEQEIDRVTTPKGCTIVGLNEMEHAGFSSALIKGIVASYKRIEK